MTLEILIKYLHFLSIFAIVGALVSEHLLIRSTMTRREIRRISIIDAIYGMGGICVWAAGLTLWFAVGKPAAYYSNNWIFLCKIGLLVTMTLLSIAPTIFFVKHAKGDMEESVEVPKSIFMYIRLELVVVVIIPLLAVLMAKGVGYFG